MVILFNFMDLTEQIGELGVVNCDQRFILFIEFLIFLFTILEH